MNIRQRFATDGSIIFYKAVEQHRINDWRSMARHVTDWESEMIENLFEDESSVQAPVPDEAARSMSLDLRRCFRTFISESDTNEWCGVKTLAGTGDLPDDDTCLYVYGWNHNIALRTDQNLITLNKGDFLVYRGDLIYGPVGYETNKDVLGRYCQEYGADVAQLTAKGALQIPFDETSLGLVKELKPEVVNFYFGLPPAHMRHDEMEERECDAIIAEGIEAGGHRGVFLPREDGSGTSPAERYRNSSMDFPQQIGTMSPVPQIVDAVKLLVMAAGRIGDAPGVLAASAFGASAVQMGTVFLLADETKTSALYRKRLKEAASGGDTAETAITNVFSGRPARGFVARVMRELGPVSVAA
ncbi:hypothetical protein Pcac1_g22984 [Phytophthora cactorum]|nr:hypothetical protein Pcac1_g22984 [Phytophthora cactorum]